MPGRITSKERVTLGRILGKERHYGRILARRDQGDTRIFEGERLGTWRGLDQPKRINPRGLDEP